MAAVITTLSQQITALKGQVQAHFRAHPDAEIIASQPGLGPIPGARVLAGSGDDPHRYTTAKARKNYAATSPITRQPGKTSYVPARHVHNDRLRAALARQACCALTASSGARAYYDQLRARKTSHDAALRQLANRLAGIQPGCLKTHTLYHETIAWPTPGKQSPAAA
jgi:transposase